jgi:hypothetical protein
MQEYSFQEYYLPRAATVVEHSLGEAALRLAEAALRLAVKGQEFVEERGCLTEPPFQLLQVV